MSLSEDAGGFEEILMSWAELIQIEAKFCRYCGVEKTVSKYRTAKRLQDGEFANEQYENREVTHYYDHDGCLVIKARLPAEQGALVVKALEMATDADFAERSPDDVSAVTSEDNDEPLSIGRRSRTIPPPMRRALRARDKALPVKSRPMARSDSRTSEIKRWCHIA